METTISAEILKEFPAVDTAAVDALLRREIEADDTKFIVLDDDPTGVQTVHDISVYTDWTVESICSGLQEPRKLFYILTNSRGLDGGGDHRRPPPNRRQRGGGRPPAPGSTISS